jgi:FtsH-binding integral membrane protein
MMSSLRLRRTLLGVLLVTALCAWCGWASAYRRSTWQGWAIWLASLLGVVLANLSLQRGRRGLRFGWPLRPGKEWPAEDRAGRGVVLAGLSPWIALALIAVAWDALGIDTGTHTPHLTISALSQAFRPLNAAVLLVWIAVGVAYGVARSRRVDAACAVSGDGLTSVAVLGLARASWIAIHHRLALPALLEGRNRGVGVGFWVGLVICGVIIDFTARRSAGRSPSFVQLLRFVSRPVVARIVLVAAWTFAGWHLFAH